MRDLLANTKPLWYALYLGERLLRDSNGDYTGETAPLYEKPVPFRGNISPARGNADEDAFGTNLDYSKTISTARMDLPIDEHTLIWEGDPKAADDGTTVFDNAQYRVVAVARGIYHVKYAIQKLQRNEAGSNGKDNQGVPLPD